MKDRNVSTSSEVTLFDNDVLETIKKLKNQRKLAGIYKELTKHLEPRA